MKILKKILIVIVVLGIVSAYAMMKAASPAELSLPSQAQKLAGDIRHAQTLAYTSGKHLRLTITPGVNGTYQVSSCVTVNGVVTSCPTTVFSGGVQEGVGAISKWEAKQMGEGSMKVTASEAGKLVKFDLSFDHGKYLSTGTFTFEPDTGGTKVTWGMDGNVSRNPMDRYFSLLMDSMVGKDFEEGLGNLKKQAEGK